MRKKVAKKSNQTKKFPTKAIPMAPIRNVPTQPMQQPQGRPDTPLAETPEPQPMM